MTDENVTGAPERIWAAPEHPDENGYGGFWIKHKVAPAIEYIRADLAPSWHRIDDPDNPPPKDEVELQTYQEILGFGDGTLIHQSYYIMSWLGKHGWIAEGNVSVQPTHWMPLPAPPEGER